METVILKNGAIESEVVVSLVMFSLRALMAEHPTAFYDLVMKCRDREYEWFHGNEDICKANGLVEQSGGIHNSIENIILSAVSGDANGMTLSSPIES
jgi:hypothetical protein